MAFGCFWLQVREANPSPKLLSGYAKKSSQFAYVLGQLGFFFNGYIPYIPSWDVASITSEPSSFVESWRNHRDPQGWALLIHFPNGLLLKSSNHQGVPGVMCLPLTSDNGLDIAVKFRVGSPSSSRTSAVPHVNVVNVEKTNSLNSVNSRGMDPFEPWRKKQPMVFSLRQSKQVVAHGKGSSHPMFFCMRWTFKKHYKILSTANLVFTKGYQSFDPDSK